MQSRKLVHFMQAKMISILITKKWFNICVSILSCNANHLPSTTPASLLHTKTTITDISTRWAKPVWIHYSFFDALSITIPQTRSTELASNTNAKFITANSFKVICFLTALVATCSIDWVIMFLRNSLGYQEKIFFSEFGDRSDNVRHASPRSMAGVAQFIGKVIFTSTVTYIKAKQCFSSF